MISTKNANAMAEVIYYLKGIRQEDIDKIPKKFMVFLNENASKEYECKFDYTKPLKELELIDETRGIIGMICYNYWCVTEQQKEQYLTKITQNEQKYQERLHEKYNPVNLFRQKHNDDSINEINNNKETALAEYKEKFFIKFKKFILKLLHIKT